MNKPIRILHVVQRMESAGLQSFIMNIYRNIDRSKVQFDFLTHYEKEDFFDNEIEELGGNIYRLSVREDFNFLRYFKELNVFFKKHQEYKVVHGHMNSLGMFYLYAAKKNSIPVRIAHAHNVLGENSFKGLMKKLTGKFYKRYATDLFACSTDSGKAMFSKDSFEVILNSIDTKAFAYDEKKRIENRVQMNLKNKFVVGHIGRFTEPKNHTFLLDVFFELQKSRENAVLLLVGQGELEKKILDKIKLLNLESKVIMIGVRNDVAELYQVMDVFLFPSLREGLGIVAVEAQTSGLLTVTSNTLPKEVKIGDNYHSISLDKSSVEWSNIILDLSSDYERNDKSKNTIQAGYDVKEVSERLQNFYLRGF